MAGTPGLLYVTMQPESGLPEAQFHDWYNNEHGPLRVRLPFCNNGFRYRATDLSSSSPASKNLPEWLAVYDITDMTEMNKETYLSLRGDTIKTPREKATMAQIAVDRKLFDLVSSASVPDFRPIDSLSPPATATVLIARSVTLKSSIPDAEEKFNAWYTEEHLPLLMKVPGWQRTRRYVTSSILAGKEKIEHLALHEYTVENGLGGEAFKKAISTPWREKVFDAESGVVESQYRRTYSLYYVFGPAPRELSALASKETQAWNSIDQKTHTYPAAVSGESSAKEGIPALSSFVTTPDGVDLPYRLSGAIDPVAPLLILINSILVTHNIWDHFLASFSSTPLGSKYRILRYNSRGRSSAFGAPDKEITMDVLAADAIAILDALRVPKAAAVIGVSVGGATALNAALLYPHRFGAWIACDFNANSSPGNVKAWEERIALSADDTSGTAASDDRVVGEKLAEATVRRWFVPRSYDDAGTAAEIARVKDMVRTNSFTGFKHSVRALYEYDLRPKMKECEVPGLLVVGSGDGALPGAMEKMKDGFPKMEGRVDCVVVSEAGHLPMVEKPQEFSEVVERFLGAL